MATRHFVPREYPFAFTNGVQASWLEVDTDTGFIKLLKHWVVEDCGTIINPQLVDEQIRGGVVQGLGAALFEHCIYDERGQLTNANMADYLVPMSGEMPDIDVGHVVSPTLETELGAKGAGEAGTAGAAAAVANAVNDALKPFGAMITEIPLTPRVILTALGTDLTRTSANKIQHTVPPGGGCMTKRTTRSGSISRRRLLTTASAGAVARGFAVSHQSAAGAGSDHQDRLPGAADRALRHRGAGPGARRAKSPIAEFNEAGGLNGRKAELLVRDDKLNPGEAATRTLELIEKEKVNFIVGSLSAAVQLAINNVTKERRIIFNSISQSDAINEVEGLQPIHLPRGAQSAPHRGRGRPLRVPEIRQEGRLPHRRLRLWPRDGPRLPAKPARHSVSRRSADIRHPLGTTDFSALLPRIQALKPDILCISNFGRDQQIALKQATDFGMKKTTQIIAPILLYTRAGSRPAPQAFEGVIGGTSYYWGIEDKVASAKAFNDRFRKVYGGKVPSDYGALGYGGVRTRADGASRPPAASTPTR